VNQMHSDYFRKCTKTPNESKIHNILIVRHSPRGAKYVEGLGVDVVVYHAGVDGKQAHNHDDVATTEEGVPDLQQKTQPINTPPQTCTPTGHLLHLQSEMFQVHVPAAQFRQACMHSQHQVCTVKILHILFIRHQ
jgi:hypothetical protein